MAAGRRVPTRDEKQGQVPQGPQNPEDEAPEAAFASTLALVPAYQEGVSLRASPGPLTLAGWIYRRSKIIALKPPSARGAMLHLFSASLTSLEVIEEDPLVLAFHPPELPPKFVPLRARTI